MSKSKEEVTVGELRNLIEGIDPNTKLSFYNNSKPMPFHEVVDQLREFKARSGGGEVGMTDKIESCIERLKELTSKGMPTEVYETLRHITIDLESIHNAPIAYAVRGIESGEIVGLYLSKLSSVNEGLEQFPVKLLPMEVE